MAERDGRVTPPAVPTKAQSNAHIYYLIFELSRTRDQVQERLRGPWGRLLFPLCAVA